MASLSIIPSDEKMIGFYHGHPEHIVMVGHLPSCSINGGEQCLID